MKVENFLATIVFVVLIMVQAAAIDHQAVTAVIPNVVVGITDDGTQYSTYIQISNPYKEYYIGSMNISMPKDYAYTYTYDVYGGLDAFGSNKQESIIGPYSTSVRLQPDATYSILLTSSRQAERGVIAIISTNHDQPTAVSAFYRVEKDGEVPYVVTAPAILTNSSNPSSKEAERVAVPIAKDANQGIYYMFILEPREEELTKIRNNQVTTHIDMSVHIRILNADGIQRGQTVHWQFKLDQNDYGVPFDDNYPEGFLWKDMDKLPLPEYEFDGMLGLYMDERGGYRIRCVAFIGETINGNHVFTTLIPTHMERQ